MSAAMVVEMRPFRLEWRTLIASFAATNECALPAETFSIASMCSSSLRSARSVTPSFSMATRAVANTFTVSATKFRTESTADSASTISRSLGSFMSP